MKKNKDILANSFEPNGFSIQRALGLADDHTLIADPAYKRILFAMKEAQVEAIKEMVKKYTDYFSDMVVYYSEAQLKIVDDIALELIKEIES